MVLCHLSGNFENLALCRPPSPVGGPLSPVLSSSAFALRLGSQKTQARCHHGERGNKEGKPQTPGLGGGGGLRSSTRALTQLGLFLAVWPQAGHMTSLSLLPCGSGPGRMKLGHSCRALSVAPAARGLVVGGGSGTLTQGTS